MTLPHPTHVRGPVGAPFPHDGEIDAHAEWEARLDAADKTPVDPAVEASIRASEAVFRRYRAAMGER